MRKRVIDHLKLVDRMRQAQRQWFKTHDRKYLIESKQLEMQVDLDQPKLMEALMTMNHAEKKPVPQTV